MGGIKFASEREMIAVLDPDRARREANERAGHSLCSHCGGTGNELYAMYRTCPECGGNGIAERYGARWAPVRVYLLRLERKRRQRRYRPPLTTAWLKGEVYSWLSYWSGRGNWFHDRRDTCLRCHALPSDVDFEMRRVGPRRVECTWGCEAEA